jgi:hypothetical protein
MKWKRANRRSIKGLGDAVEVLAQPIASAIDIVFNTSVKDCGSCQNRKQALNDWFPFKDEETGIE